MRSLIHDLVTGHTPESLVDQLRSEPGIVLLRSALFDAPQARYSLVVARPFMTFRSTGSRCEIVPAPAQSRMDNSTPDFPNRSATIPSRRLTDSYIHYGNPWRLLESLMSRYELLDEVDHPFPLGGCFGYWGYDLKNFVEPKLQRRAQNDLELPDCHVGFYDSLVVFDHRLGKAWIISTGLQADGARSESRAKEQVELWLKRLGGAATHGLATARGGDTPRPGGDRPLFGAHPLGGSGREKPSPEEVQPTSLPGEVCPRNRPAGKPARGLAQPVEYNEGRLISNLGREDFMAGVKRAQAYIRAGDIYQVNLSHRLHAPSPYSGWELFQRLAGTSPAPFSGFLDCGTFQIASSSPELFLHLSGAHIQTRPIKGTRPRSTDPTRDAQLAFELQTSVKEMAELIMITDLLRSDLGKICEFGSVQVPELLRLERYAQVQHLVSTVEGRLRPDLSHFAALGSCFPGGSITGAPKFRAMEIIDELEPVSRGPYTGALGYLGFNRESQLSIIIRTAICAGSTAYFQVGAGIVADSIPAAEYEETLAKARGFCEALLLDTRQLDERTAKS